MPAGGLQLEESFEAIDIAVLDPSASAGQHPKGTLWVGLEEPLQREAADAVRENEPGDLHHPLDAGEEQQRPRLHEGFDALLTGEPEEPNYATSKELGIHLLAAGHHATERFGVQALAEHLAATFAIEWRYYEVENPV